VRLHRDMWWLLGSTVVAVCAAPLLVQGNAETTARRMDAVRKVEAMSPADRQRLNENFKRFDQLSKEEQEKFRDMHARVEQNAPVREAFQTFADWWPTVPPPEQAELFGEADAKKRVEIVAHLQDEIDEDRVRQVYQPRWGGRPWQKSMPRDSFYEVMQALEALATESYRIGEELPEIQELDPRSPQRYLKLITALNSKQQSWNSLVSSPAAENRLVEAVSNAAVREGVKKGLNERALGPIGPKGLPVRSQLAMSLAKELYLENLKQAPDDSDLMQRFNGLSKEEKEALYSYSADEIRHQLRARMFKDLMGAFAPVPEFFGLLGGRGPGSPDNRRDGQGRPDDPRRPGEGPSPNDGGRPERRPSDR
jgi:hypothetical protein